MKLTEPAKILIEENETLTVLSNRMLVREGKSEETLRRYMDGINEFTEYVKASSADKALKILVESEDRTQKLDRFIDFLIKKGKKPVSIKANWQGVKKWLIANRINNIDWDYISRPKVASQIKDRIPTPEELRLILSNKVTLRDKAFFMTAASSGLRLGTLVTLKVGDFSVIEDLGKIEVEGGDGRKLAKGKSYFTFVTPETREIIEHYLQTRKGLSQEQPLFTKENGEPVANYVQNVSRQWRRIVKRANLLNKIPNHKWVELHGHTLRKFFQTHCKLAGCRSDFVDFWMGHHPTHSEGYLNDSYFRPDLKAHIFEYRKAVAHLQIFSTKTKEIFDLQDELKSVKGKLAFLDKYIGSVNEVIEDKQDMERLWAFFEALRKEKEAEE